MWEFSEPFAHFDSKNSLGEGGMWIFPSSTKLLAVWGPFLDLSRFDCPP
jgi:hypothetical protein